MRRIIDRLAGWRARRWTHEEGMPMTCVKCAGLVVVEQVPAETMVLTIHRCLLCGMQREPGHVPLGRASVHRGRVPGARCTNCKNDRAPGFSQCEVCRQYQRAYRKVNQDRRHWRSRKPVVSRSVLST